MLLPEPSLTASDRLLLEEVVLSLRHPPCAPRVVPVLKRHLLNPNAPMFEIVDLIKLDPGVAARVLQAANSALFNRGERCHSVATAVGRIGFDHIFDIVATAVAEQVLVRPLTSYSVEADDFWRRSIACGLAAEHIAMQLDEDANVAYALGLFHGVGMVAIDQWAQRNAPSLGFLSRGFPRDFTDSERALIGLTNAEVGSAVLRSWEFPAEMSEPLRWQFAPLDSSAHRRLNCLLYAARWIAARLCGSPERPPCAPEDRFLAPLRLNASNLAREVPTVRERLEEVQRRLEEVQSGGAA
jgi:HD-like signal output (HDOD) protein